MQRNRLLAAKGFKLVGLHPDRTKMTARRRIISSFYTENLFDFSSYPWDNRGETFVFERGTDYGLFI